MHKHKRTSIYTCTHTHTHTRTHTHTHTHLFSVSLWPPHYPMLAFVQFQKRYALCICNVCMHVCMHACMRVCMDTWMHGCMTHTHTHTHTHTLYRCAPWSPVVKLHTKKVLDARECVLICVLTCVLICVLCVSLYVSLYVSVYENKQVFMHVLAAKPSDRARILKSALSSDCR